VAPASTSPDGLAEPASPAPPRTRQPSQEDPIYRFDTPAPPRLTIEFRAGTVTIDTADVVETTVDLQPRHESKASRDAVAATVIEQRGDEIVVLVPSRFGGLLGRSADLALTVTAPHATKLHASAGSADIVARGRFAMTTVTTGSGDVELGDVEDSARLRSGSGRLRVASIAKDVQVVTGSGDIDLGVLTGSGVVQSGSGDVRIGSGGAALEIKTGSGDVSIGTAPVDVSVRTASGDISIDAVTTGEVRAKAASGDIHAGVRSGTAAWLDVRTISGRVTSDLESGGQPSDDEARARLRLETASGDIELVRV
jgi:Putative adhesin